MWAADALTVASLEHLRLRASALWMRNGFGARAFFLLALALSLALRRPPLQGRRLAGPHGGAHQRSAVLERRPPEWADRSAGERRRSRRPRGGRRQRIGLFGRRLLRSRFLVLVFLGLDGRRLVDPSAWLRWRRQRHHRNVRLGSARADGAGRRAGYRRPRRTCRVRSAGSARRGRPVRQARPARQAWRDRSARPGRRASRERRPRAARRARPARSARRGRSDHRAQSAPGA